MPAPPAGESCSNCDFFDPVLTRCCRSPPPLPGGPAWPHVEPTDWCAHHNLWPESVGNALSWGQPAPDGGSNGDYYTQYDVIKSGSNNYVNQITFWQNQKGVWSEITSIQDPWP
jgi:hypothetical protein